MERTVHNITTGETSVVQMTQAEIDAIPPYIDTRTYAEKRRAEYPPMADYLDAVVKGDVVGQQAYIDACLAVKAKYPKV